MKNNLKMERVLKELTQQGLADKVNVTRQTINALEKCKFVPSTVLAIKIAKTFNKSVEDIFFLEPSD